MLDKNIILTAILIIGTFASLKTSSYFLNKIGTIKKVSKKRIHYISKTFAILIILVSFLFLAMVWGISLNGILVFTSSIFAVVGVALFAQWSTLSNITSSIIIFFTFPTRTGDMVEIVDGENSITGEILEISLFQVKLLNNDGDIVIYPNNLFIQKPVIQKSKQTSI